MKRPFLVLSLVVPALLGAEETPAVAVSTAAPAEEDVFISLTRTAQPRGRLPTNASVVRREDLDEEDAVALDEALPSVPSVIIQKSGTLGTFSTLRLRGSPSSAQTQVLLDDLPLSGISDQFLDISQLPLLDVERVEVLRGGASAIYGPNAVGGVVRLVPKRHVGDRPLTRFRGTFGSFYEQVYEGEFSSRIGAGDVRVTGGRSLSDGFTDNQDTDNIYASAGAGYTGGSGARVSATVSVVDGEVGNPKGTTLEVGEWNGKKERRALDPTARVENKAVRSHADLFIPMGEMHLKSSVFTSQEDYRSVESTAPGSDFFSDTNFWGNDTRLVWRDRLTLGAAYGWDGQQTEYQDFFTLAPVRGARHVTNAAGYAQADFSRGPWRVIPSVRYDDHSDFSGEWSPAVSVVLSASRVLRFSANAGRSFRAPSFLELSARGPGFTGNPDLKPQESESYDAGLEIASSSASRVALTGFYTVIEDWIAVSNSGTTYENAPSAELSGLEVESAFPVVGESVLGALTYTYTRAIGNTLGTSTRLPLRLSPRHQLYGRLWLKPGRGWELLNTVQYLSKQFYLNGEKGPDLPPHAVWNIRLSKRILAAELFFSAENVLDRRYALTFDSAPLFPHTTSRNPQPGRTYRVGATIAFQD